MGCSASTLRSAGGCLSANGWPEGNRRAARDPDADKRAIRMAQRIVPFVPRRIVKKFLQGHLNGAVADARAQRNETELDSGNFSFGSLLVIDVSGFTRLSQFYSRQGSEGAEQFSLSLSGFLARMTAIITGCGGDVDAFAGDAALVVFESLKGASEIPETALKALRCALQVYSDLNGYQSSADEPQLFIHAALAS
eukprot:scaffold51831_cov24-Prasinocladus_malaysianus.AAC.1